MNFEAIAESLPLYASGLATTLQLLLISLAIGLVAALPLAVLRVSASRWLHGAVWCFTYVIRGTPLLVQLFLVYYGLAQFEWVRASIAWPWLQSAWFCACLAFAVNTCAYTTEIIAGSLKATPHGEVEAARALGLSRAQVWRRILLPSALRRALPAYGNEAVLMLHGTSLASVVTLLDLTGAAREVNSRFYLPFEAFLTAAAVYLGLTLALVGALHAAERRWLAHLRPRA
ncbi:amino acid ABC transporter permease [Methylibium sp. Pch-M]|uniref:ABC transporter permease n=1 Tax=Methylibium sp. Pch-M TaxID=2082386 RepID=UPI00101383F7|nr:ABC transporter permease [Methylibium sp. Pch-M]QAZ40506.1 amino acid ABC transporter permease [Methylibium sp. Pch-M]